MKTEFTSESNDTAPIVPRAARPDTAVPSAATANHTPPALPTAVAEVLNGGKPEGKTSPFLSVGTLFIPLHVLAIFVSFQIEEYALSLAWLCSLTGILLAMRVAVLVARKRTIDRSLQLGKNWLGPITAALDWHDSRHKDMAARLLTKLLPIVREGDAGYFTMAERHSLYRRLSPRAARARPALAVSILRALPHIGQDGALPYVRRLAARRAFTPGGLRVRAAAVAALPLLEERCENLRVSEIAGTGGVSGADEVLSESEREERARSAAEAEARLKEYTAALGTAQSPGMRMGFLFAAWVVIIPFFSLMAVQAFSQQSPVAGTVSAVIALLCTQLHRLTLSNKHTTLADRVSSMADVQCIGKLAEMLDWPDAHLRNVAIQALNRLLPEVRASDSLGLTHDQRASLYRMLSLSNAGSHMHLMLNILKALEQIGDATALPFVDRLAAGQASSPAQARVIEAANGCLPALQERCEINRSSQTLLRASSSSARGTDTLMRAAHVPDSTDPAQLLRPDLPRSQD